MWINTLFYLEFNILSICIEFDLKINKDDFENFGHTKS